MKRILLTIGVGVITFVLGVSATVGYWLSQLSEPSLDQLQVTGPVQSTCFPGFALNVEKSASYSKYFSPSTDLFSVEWYRKTLVMMDEEPLPSMMDEDESYRFLWLRAFNHPIAIHISRTGSNQTIVMKELSSADLDIPAKLIGSESRSLSTPEWNEFMQRLEIARFWQMPADSGPMGFDGSQWVLEGYREGRYYVVDRWSPDTGAYRDACLYLLEKSGVLARIPAKTVY